MELPIWQCGAHVRAELTPTEEINIQAEMEDKGKTRHPEESYRLKMGL